MTDAPVLSVVMPILRVDANFPQARSRVHSATSSHELIMVLNDETLAGTVRAERSDELVVVCRRRGRGFALSRGVAEARGGTVLLLHADTLLPEGWDGAVLRALSDARVVGGGFHLAFDRTSPSLDFILGIADMMVFLGASMWGDRALFARASVLRDCLPALDVPLFEDVRLNKALKRHGRLVLMDETVVTSAQHFTRNGTMTQGLRIVKACSLYILGVDPQRIYDYYYSQ